MEQLGCDWCLISMRTAVSRFLAAYSLLCISGCKDMHLRPAGVPSAAVWVDHTFIDCSVETKSRANRCTVYKDDSGEILADGLFLLNYQLSPADAPDLRYAAFGGGKIYLQDARVLVQWTASNRDPSLWIVNGRLKALAGRGSSIATDCNAAQTNATDDHVAACGMRAFAAKTPFYLHYYQQGFDSFGFSGLASDEGGNVYELEYNSRPLPMLPPQPKEVQVLDDHTVVVTCHKPVTLERWGNGYLVCQAPLDW
jgi:hypothetical protein